MQASTSVLRVQPCAAFLQPCRFSRRTTQLPPWIGQIHEKYALQNLTHENAAFVKKQTQTTSPLKDEPWEYPEWTESSKRTGLLVRKIGVYPHWLHSGKRVQCTLLQVLNNHVINYTSPDDWYKYSPVGKRKAFNRFGVHGKLTIGADDVGTLNLHVNIDGRLFQYTPSYRNQFSRAGVPVKRHMAGFVITEDAKVQPGTKLYAAHFDVGQYVTVSGKSIDWGFEGAVHRWGMHGGHSDQQGGSKSHRRVGAIGSQGTAIVKPGKRMPGHMGWEWVHNHGIKVMRIDHDYQMIWVLGPGIAGDPGEVLHLKDSMMEKKKRENPPFPTYIPGTHEEPVTEQYDDALHLFNGESISYEAGDDEDYAAILKRATVKKQAKAKK